VRLLLDQLKTSGTQSWTELADSLGVSKQTLTGFQKGRLAALDAEAVLRLCSRCDLSLGFEGKTIGCGDPMPHLTMEFDDNFQSLGTAPPSVLLTRKPPGRVSYIGVRFEQASGPRR
jgi:DNA-binding Xre family transcriptional regulator